MQVHYSPGAPYYLINILFKGTLKAGGSLPLKYCISIVLAKKIVPPPLWSKEGYNPGFSLQF